MKLSRYEIGIATVVTVGTYYIRCMECRKNIASDMPLTGTYIQLIDTVKPIEAHEELNHK